MKSWTYLCVTCLALISLECIIVTPQEEQLSDFLWRKTIPMHNAALGSSFIQGLKKISLDPTNFGAYMVQDSVYCYAVKNFLDVAASRVRNDTRLKEFLQARSASYERYYKALFQSWHISNANGIELGNASERYIKHLYNVSQTFDPTYLVAALIPCARLWPWLGGEIQAKTADFGVYSNWVKENLNPDGHGYQKYEDVINAAYKEGRINKNDALRVYARSMKGEVDFFSSV